MKKYFIITRYNLGLWVNTKKRKIDPDEWMDNRFELFKKYSAASVNAQTDMDFIWIILYDSCTAPCHLFRIFSCSPVNTIQLKVNWPSDMKFAESGKYTPWSKQLARIAGCDEAVMTRLDNDDALNIRFMEALKPIAHNAGHLTVIDSTIGAALDESTGEAWMYGRNYGSPFLTMVSNVGSKMKTPYYTCHRNIAIGNRHQLHLDLAPAWLMVIHENNVSNRRFKEFEMDKIKWEVLKQNFGL